MSSGAQGRGLCWPPEELPALQLVGAWTLTFSSDQLRSSVTGEERARTSSAKSGRDSLSAFLIKIQQHLVLLMPNGGCIPIVNTIEACVEVKLQNIKSLQKIFLLFQQCI